MIRLIKTCIVIVINGLAKGKPGRKKVKILAAKKQL